MGVLVGKPAPDFDVAAVKGDGEIVDSYKRSAEMEGKYGLVFFYPLDFTFVCPSELIALDHRMDKFRELGVEVVAVSIDSQFTHNAWRNTPVDQGGIGAVSYTMAADVNHDICRAYDVETDGEAAPVIAGGCGIPISCNTVGAIADRFLGNVCRSAYLLAVQAAVPVCSVNCGERATGTIRGNELCQGHELFTAGTK